MKDPSLATMAIHCRQKLAWPIVSLRLEALFLELMNVTRRVLFGTLAAAPTFAIGSMDEDTRLVYHKKTLDLKPSLISAFSINLWEVSVLVWE